MKVTDRQSDLDLLWPQFRANLERWLAQAAATFPQFDIRVTETRRTQARQKYLYSLGRTRQPYGKVVTYSLDSNHQYGLAADIAIIRKRTGKAEWGWETWKAVYTKVAPETYGLEKLEWEMPHLQIAGADGYRLKHKELGLNKT